MKKHTKVYIDFFNYFHDEHIPCEMCGDKAVDVHHLDKQSKFGSKKEKDYIENLIGVCRDCHIKAESDPIFNMYCKIKHLENVCIQVYALIDINKKLKNYENSKSK